MGKNKNLMINCLMKLRCGEGLSILSTRSLSVEFQIKCSPIGVFGVGRPHSEFKIRFTGKHYSNINDLSQIQYNRDKI
jgi:hypothetical protein